MSDSTAAPRGPSLLDRFLRLFSEVHAGESATALLMLANIFIVLVAYYVLKTLREPLILAGGELVLGSVTIGEAALASYASAGQALVLIGLVPLYAWFAAKVDRMRLIWGVTLFFFACIEVFWVGALLEVPYLGIFFFIWVGTFSVSIIAQFWSYANDIYTRAAGERLFPIIAIGATLGAVFGPKLAKLFRDALDVAPFQLMQLAAVLLLSHLVLYWLVNRRETRQPGASKGKQLASGGAFALVLKTHYLRMIALLLILLNLVNTTGEYIIRVAVKEWAEAAVLADPALVTDVLIFDFYSSYYFWVNLGTVLIQAFVVSRIVKYLGMAGVLFALPVIAFGAYGLIAAGVGLTAVRWAKSAENMTDYSVMNTAKAMLWLPTTREEKYKAKQAIDTFFVRLGDVLAAGLVLVGTAVVPLQLHQFALVNLVLIALWAVVGVLVLREYKRLAALQEPTEEAA